MKMLKIFLMSLFCVVLVNNGFADDFAGPRNRCKAQSNKFWVEDTKTCIPEDPCSSATDAGIRDAYCVKSSKDINVEVNGSDGYSRSVDGKFCYSESDDTIMIVTPDFDYKCYRYKSGNWQVKFYYGQIRGAAICSAKKGDNHNFVFGGDNKDWLSDEEILKAESGEKTNCWCSLQDFLLRFKYAENIGTNAVFYDDFRDCEDCENRCADECLKAVLRDSAFRSALFFGN